MTDYEKLIDKLRKLEAVFSGTNYEGERTAASVAIDKIREKLKSVEIVDPPTEHRFTMGDMWSRKLFVALLRRYGLTPYRYSGQRYTTVMVNVSPKFVSETLWPEFLELSKVLQEYLTEITDKVITESIFADTSDAETRSEPARLESH
ncbi:MAG: hypothetical protein O2856_17100 [Planctomycetota bacterium]|nr:hypothetical protein [Planctomycetota bacterium]